VGGFLTEFGALYNTEAAAVELDFVLNNAEKRFHSWTYW